MVNGAFFLGGMVGMLIFGIVTANASFVTAYALCIVLGLVSLALTFVFIGGGDPSASDVSPQAFPTSGQDEPSPCWDVVSTVNPIAVFRNCYRVLTKRRQHHGTVILCLAVLACAPLTCVPIAGESDLTVA